MWTEEQIVNDLRDLGLAEGATVLAHTSLRAIGEMERGADTLAQAFRRVLGANGTLMVPAFSLAHSDPTDWRIPAPTPDEAENLRAGVPLFDPAESPVDTDRIGYFAEYVRHLPDARRSHHPAYSFVAIGSQAAFLTQSAPFHYPLGSDSPLSRLHQLDGWTLLIGVGHPANASLHLAEVWAEVPYIHRSRTLKTGPDQWTGMQGSPECSAGFGRIEALLRQSRVLRQGYVGNASCQLMRQRPLVSMAIAMLRGEGSSLLCADPECPWCSVARKLTVEPY